MFGNTEKLTERRKTSEYHVTSHDKCWKKGRALGKQWVFQVSALVLLSQLFSPFQVSPAHKGFMVPLANLSPACPLFILVFSEDFGLICPLMVHSRCCGTWRIVRPPGLRGWVEAAVFCSPGPPSFLATCSSRLSSVC